MQINSQLNYNMLTVIKVVILLIFITMIISKLSSNSCRLHLFSQNKTLCLVSSNCHSDNSIVDRFN